MEPDIPWNTGNVGRTCLGLNAELYLLGRLGFSLEDRYLKRSGLDYWSKVPLTVQSDIQAFFNDKPLEKVFFFSTKAKKSYYETTVPSGAYLVFGAETKGLPAFLHQQYPERFFKLPITKAIRSLNLSTSVGMALGEAVRQNTKGESICQI